jgi:hypothetical protein
MQPDKELRLTTGKLSDSVQVPDFVEQVSSVGHCGSRVLLWSKVESGSRAGSKRIDATFEYTLKLRRSHRRASGFARGKRNSLSPECTICSVFSNFSC